MMLGVFGLGEGLRRPTFAHAVFLAAAILIGCGGGGGGGGSSSGVTGGVTNATTGATVTGGSTGATTGATTGSTTATTTASTTGTTTTTGGSTGSSTTGSSTGSTTGSTTGTTTGGTTGSDPFTFYYGSDATGTEKGYRISSDGTGKTAINTGSNAVSLIAVNKQGTKLAFVVWDTYKHIFVVNPDGTGLQQLTTDDWDTSWPCFSPDGTKILYSSYESGTPQLWTMNVDGTGKAALTNFPSGAIQGRYSPNGQKIVYVSSSTNDDVYIMNANGTSATALAASGADDENQPAFTSDSSKVVFVKSFDNSGESVGQVMIVNATGGTPSRLTSTLLDDREPVVSQDGTTILFTRPSGGFREVFKMSLTGTGQTKVTNEAAFSVSPSSGN